MEPTAGLETGDLLFTKQRVAVLAVPTPHNRCFRLVAWPRRVYPLPSHPSGSVPGPATGDHRFILIGRARSLPSLPAHGRPAPCRH